MRIVANCSYVEVKSYGKCEFPFRPILISNGGACGGGGSSSKSGSSSSSSSSSSSMRKRRNNTGLFISPSGISELDSATTKTHG